MGVAWCVWQWRGVGLCSGGVCVFHACETCARSADGGRGGETWGSQRQQRPNGGAGGAWDEHGGTRSLGAAQVSSQLRRQALSGAERRTPGEKQPKRSPPPDWEAGEPTAWVEPCCCGAPCWTGLGNAHGTPAAAFFSAGLVSAVRVPHAAVGDDLLDLSCATAAKKSSSPTSAHDLDVPSIPELALDIAITAMNGAVLGFLWCSGETGVRTHRLRAARRTSCWVVRLKSEEQQAAERGDERQQDETSRGEA